MNSDHISYPLPYAHSGFRYFVVKENKNMAISPLETAIFSYIILLACNITLDFPVESQVDKVMILSSALNLTP